MRGIYRVGMGDGGVSIKPHIEDDHIVADVAMDNIPACWLRDGAVKVGETIDCLGACDPVL